ncbi:MAG: FecR family protein [bacterium]
MKKILLLAFLFSIPAFAAADEARILAVHGKVEVKVSKDRDWAPAAENMEVLQGGEVRTGGDGRAVLLLPNKTRLWLKEGSNIELEQRQSMASRIALLFGKLKARVPHLRRRERFEVRTQTAVCAVRGTEFVVDANEEGAMKIEVLYGQVNTTFTVPPEKGASYMEIAQGRTLEVKEKGKPGTVALMTKEQETKAIENWNPGLAPEQRRAEMKAKEQDRREIRQFAAVTGATENRISNMVAQVKESDLEAGRTLRDVHGNLVRVDQRMMRPESNSMQIVNLVKRPVYNHVNRRFAGSYNTSNRLDSLSAKITFSDNLPQNLSDWPGYFESHDNLKPQSAVIVAANQTDSNNIFAIASVATYDAATDELDDQKRIYYTPASGYTFTDMGNLISKADTTGLDWAKDYPTTGAITDARLSIDSGDSGGPLYQYEAIPFCKLGDCTGNNKLWFAQENFVIDNNGKIKNVGDFTNTSSDPFSILKNSAAETIWYLRKDSAGLPDYSASGDFGPNKNIDLVIIPDIGVAAVQRMLPALDKISN